MIFTARQLQALHKSNGQIVLPYAARLTPLAADWVRAKKISLGYSDVETPSANVAQGGSTDAVPKRNSSGLFLWWCDGPCGPAKAALMAQSRESNFAPLPLGSELTQLVSAVKAIAAKIKSKQAAGAVLLVQSGAAAMVYANRCPSIRAVLATTLEAVDQGVQQLAANMLVIEHPNKQLPQVKSFLSRFVRGQREVTEHVKRQLEELNSCG